MVIEVSTKPKKWTRSSDGWVSGVFEGLGKSFSIEPNILRLLWLISVLFFGTGILIYLILTFALPREDEYIQYEQPKFLGVCLRLSRRTGIELGLLRLLTVMSVFASFGITLVAYIGMYFFLPEPLERIYF
jgi:phage shock protein C